MILKKLSTDSRNDVHPNTRTYSFGVNVKFLKATTMKSINNFIGLALLSGALLTSCSDSFFAEGLIDRIFIQYILADAG